jgi:hypothetical protein
MRSTRVWGRTIELVVETFEREQERAFSSLRRGHFCRARARIPRLLTSTEIEARSSAYTRGCTTRISRSIQSFVCTEIKEQNSVNYVRTVQIYQSVKPYFGTVFEEGQSVVHTSYRTDSVQVRTVFSWHKNRGRLCDFSGKFGIVFKAVIHALMHPKIC